MKNFASYEKTVVSKVQRIEHTVRMRLNSTKRELIRVLENVPNDAVIEMIVGDDEDGDYGEIVFVEEKKV